MSIDYTAFMGYGFKVDLDDEACDRLLEGSTGLTYFYTGPYDGPYQGHIALSRLCFADYECIDMSLPLPEDEDVQELTRVAHLLGRGPEEFAWHLGVHVG